MSTQLLTELPNIQYTGMDFESVMEELQKIIRNNPRWSDNWSDFYSSEAGVMLLQLMSWICDNLSIRQDVLLNESFLSTANKKRNKIKLLKTIGYQPKLSHAAQAALTVELTSVSTEDIILTPEFSSSTQSLSLRTNSIPKISGYDINNNTIDWEILSLVDGKPDYLAGVKLKAGASLYTKDIDDNDIFAVEGTTLYKEFSSDTSDGPYIDLYEDKIAADSIAVYEKAFAKKCQQVTSFVTTEAMDKSGKVGIPYVVSLNEDGSIRISFAKKDVLPQERLLPAGTEISIFYRTTSGSIGNIPPTFINTNTVFTTASDENINAIVYNEATAYNGTDNENIDTAVLNAPLTLRTFDRAVTVEDYDILLNNNPSILKAKTYTASNNPNNFYETYGRYINPQEAFIFALGNRDYSKVPSSQYNNYPWFNLYKTPRLNEKYTFDNGANNVSTEILNTYYNLTVTQNEEEPKKFNNATILNLGNDFNNEVQEDLTNTDFQLKIATKQIESSYFSDIPYSLMENSEELAKTIATDLIDHKEIVIDDHARFLTKESYKKEKNDTSIDAIDILKSRYIILSLDSRVEIVIDLWENYEGHMPDINDPDSRYYVFFDYEPDPEIYPTIAPANDSSFVAAYRRHGIVQLINQQIVAVAQGESEQSRAAAEYTENNAYQWFGVSFTDQSDRLLTFDNNYLRKDLILTINDKIFKFPFSPSHTDDQTNTNYETWEEFINELNSHFQELANGVDTDFYTTIKCYDKPEGYEANTWRSFTKGEFDFTSLTAGIAKRINYTEENGYSYTFDVYLKTSNSNWLQGNKISISYETAENTGLEGNDDYKGIAFDSEYSFNSFIHTIHSVDETANYENLLGPNFEACSYENLASFVDDPENPENYGYLKIESPLTGENSSIRFLTNSSIDGTYGNFMRDFLNIPFYSNSSAGLNFSQIAYGQKRILILTSNYTIATYKNNPSDDPISIDETLVAGNLIFENSCIFNNYDFKNLYSFYKFKSVNNIELGSVYENFYYTGDPEIDEKVKDKLKYITGTVFDSDGNVDNINSNFEVKLTKGKQNTNSYYAIKDDLGVIKSDRVEIVSANIYSDVNIPDNAILCFTLDNISSEYQILAPLGGLHSGKAVARVIKDSIINNEYSSEDSENVYLKYIEVIDDVIKTDYNCVNQVSLKGLSRENGGITFYYNPQYHENIEDLYKLFLGTNRNNENLYTLYPYTMFDSSNVIDVSTGNPAEYDETGTITADEYFYCPSAEYPLRFTYRKMVNGVSTPADYYITYNNANKKYLLTKTEYSKFPSSDFYVHFINDRSSEEVEIDEKSLNAYMNDKKISGMDLYVARPYFKGYDIKATVYYNANFSEASVRSVVEDSVKKLCSIENAEIGGYISQAKIIKEIMNVDGVENVIIHYLGYDYSSGTESQAQLEADFFELICLNDYEENRHGMLFDYEIQR